MSNNYDFFSEENRPKWKSIFLGALNLVHKQVHPSLQAQTDALEYIEDLIIQLLATLCASEPHIVQDVEDRVRKTYPDPIDKWAVRDADRAIKNFDSRNKKQSTLVLPVDKIHPLLVKEVLGYRIDYTVTVYIVAVLEYIAADILKLTGNYVKNIKHSEITQQDIKVAICADQVLMDMFSQEETEVSLPLVDEPTRRESLTYEDIVKDFILEENQYLHDLNMIIKVFRAPFARHFPNSKDLENIFSNILDIYQFTAKLLSSVEEQMEVAAENETPQVGICFQDLAEGEEFGVYKKYVNDVMTPNGKDRLNTLLQRRDISETLMGYGCGFKDSMKYVLPKLLLGPIYHCLHYFEVIKALTANSPNDEDGECLEQASGLLSTLKYLLENIFAGNLAKKKPWETTLRMQGRTGRQAVVQKMSELQKSIDGWEGRDIWQSCSEFILDGVLMKHTKGKNTERHVFLFDALIVLCKQNLRRASVSGPQGEYKLKEKFQIRKMEVRDKEDCDEYKNAFELQGRDHSVHVMLVAKTPEEKSNWMAALISLQTKSMLERQLDAILREEEQMTPLKLPDASEYRFAIEDSENNIVFEDTPAGPGESPLIKGGTLLKLVERLTYHMYADPKFVRTFLTTYRSFCSPQQLLDLLIERFEIPDMPDQETDANVIEDNSENLQLRDDLKRFRKEYVKPVQFRVVNVLRHWVNDHFYDFERDVGLLEKLKSFLDTVKGKAMKKMADSILKVINRRTEQPNTEREFTYQKQPPPIEWHLVNSKEKFDLLTLHPIEIARQVTLLEFDLYRAVKPSELVGSVWTKKEKSKTSPNLLKMIEFTNNFTYWLEKCIVEAENLEERVAMVSRCIEVMIVFHELNNFNGVLEVVSALNSASVHRLEHTFSEVNHRLVKAMNDNKELNSDHFKKYIEKLRSINPPCVPFLGMYLTNILKTEEGNPDFLKRNQEGLVNFSKRRKVAEITGEIQQYQNQPYCLTVEPSIRDFIENLEPLGENDEKWFNEYLYGRSLEIEPRGCRQVPKFPKKYNYSLKSPGIRPQARDRHNATRGHTFSFTPFGGGYQRIEEDQESQSSPQCLTPPTPTTPISPGAVSIATTVGGDNGVFANVTVGQGSSSTVTVSQANVPTAELVSLATDSELQLQPPPLPPRRRTTASSRDSVSSIASSDHVFMRSFSPEPPEVPPRADHDQPPPVPPRRDSMYNTNSLSRSHSHSQVPAAPVTQPRTPTLVSQTVYSRSSTASIPPIQARTQSAAQLTSGYGGQIHSATLPRYFGGRDSRNSDNNENIFNFNGENSDIPALPPKTYRQHARKQSS
ncbi:son of sevenless homolog 2-like [Mya arenaria]|uniref:son of sevenless homolog 2-like n=1 Tax=Mya arenaria TaxID=6604 RepID=UPI0022E76BFD|nr:son of sevenless homolog 2-like [Mya arenaria]XP_052768360.1 son of sevenless homolog 2-like [Mya arenaria]